MIFKNIIVSIVTYGGVIFGCTEVRVRRLKTVELNIYLKRIILLD